MAKTPETPPKNGQFSSQNYSVPIGVESRIPKIKRINKPVIITVAKIGIQNCAGSSPAGQSDSHHQTHRFILYFKKIGIREIFQ